MRDDWNLNNCKIRASVLVVDLESHDDIACNNLSNDNSSGLIEGSSRSQKVGIELDVSNEDSSASDYVYNNSSVGDLEEVSGKDNISSSSNVHNPVGLEVAVLGDDICVLAHVSRVN